MDRHQEIFFEEAKELLTELESAALELEHAPSDMELVGRIFRAIHTLKGSSAMFGLEAVAEFAHDLETAFDLVRNGKLTVTPELVTLTLWSRDHMGELLERLAQGGEPDRSLAESGEEILDGVRRLMGAIGDDDASPPPPASLGEIQSDEAPQTRMLYRIRFKPSVNIYLTGSKPESLLEELKELGVSCEIIIHKDAHLPAGEERNADLCYSSWDVLLETTACEQSIRDVFIFVEDESELRIESLGEAGSIGAVHREKLIDALRGANDLPHAVLAEIASSAQAHPAAPSAEKEPAAVHRAAETQHTTEHKGAQNIKVPAERLDKLVDLVGELVIVQARLSQVAGVSPDARFTSIAEDVESLVWELRDTTMSLRMLPIGTTFGKFTRLVRDLSSNLGKDIRLVTEGEETELDKTVIERLGDPLVHMIRNSIDHGIELPDERERAGKARTGTVRLSAAHKGTFVHITISDDGRGLDREAIRQKAVAQGLLQEHEEYTEQEIFSTIFAPGFSTAREVTSVSGRGVGMDVVRRSIEELSGRIELSSTKGQGTTVTLKLPLTLAIVEGLLVEAGKEFFILPLAIVKECVELPKEENRRGTGGDVINVRGEIVPFIRLRDYYGTGETGTELPEHEYVVIVESDATQLGITVDRVCGQHQTVIRSLGTLYANVKGVSGATILGDGTVALIVDVPTIAVEVQKEVKNSFAYQTAAAV